MAHHIGQALPAGGGGVARNASILNARDDSILGERGLQLRRKPFLRSELIARVKTVTEGDHERCVGGNRGRRFRRNLVVRRRRWRLRRSTRSDEHTSALQPLMRN